MGPIERRGKLMQLLRVNTALGYMDKVLELDETDISNLDRAVLISFRADLVKLRDVRINEFLSDQEEAT